MDLDRLLARGHAAGVGPQRLGHEGQVAAHAAAGVEAEHGREGRLLHPHAVGRAARHVGLVQHVAGRSPASNVIGTVLALGVEQGQATPTAGTPPTEMRRLFWPSGTRTLYQSTSSSRWTRPEAVVPGTRVRAVSGVSSPSSLVGDDRQVGAARATRAGPLGSSSPTRPGSER